ncbi:hypothetical protein [Enterovibrio baiacu]|uniref:hypothetical protein n=1 Tax=Enterovibrio baiacu TaxID=2491023 RepID=UPI0010119067|nr:hypothetical protein [Enterovibrio baiacu]MBE1275087.1 hypothetical protein [Enterovibrio baiacu]
MSIKNIEALATRFSKQHRIETTLHYNAHIIEIKSGYPALYADLNTKVSRYKWRVLTTRELIKWFAMNQLENNLFDEEYFKANYPENLNMYELLSVQASDPNVGLLPQQLLERHGVYIGLDEPWADEGVVYYQQNDFAIGFCSVLKESLPDEYASRTFKAIPDNYAEHTEYGYVMGGDKAERYRKLNVLMEYERLGALKRIRAENPKADMKVEYEKLIKIPAWVSSTGKSTSDKLLEAQQSIQAIIGGI